MPDEGVHQVLAAAILTLVAEASDVEVGLGEAVANAERTVFSTGRHRDPVEELYNLKREIAEARRALSPVTTVLPELVAEADEADGRRHSQPWLRRAQAWVERLDKHLDASDHLLTDMLTAHLSQVSVRQNEDVRKISSWAAIAAAPTLAGEHLRHELPAHARARLDVRVPDRAGRHGDHLRLAVRAVPPVRLALAGGHARRWRPAHR